MRFFAALLVAAAVPVFANAFFLNNLLNGLLGTANSIAPDLRLGVRVDLLIDLSLVLEILSRPFDALHAITDCDSGLPNVHNATLGRNGLSSKDGRWYQDSSDGTWYVPIVMDPSFTSDETDTIYAGMVNIQQKTCMRFYIYQESQLSGYDYVKIIRGSGQGCYSDSIGRAHKGRQIVNLQPMEPSGCIIAGIAAHELLHAIGFDHQQCTPGRDQYVTIMWSNIRSDATHNFEEDSSSEYTSFGAPYDYGSVMHYGATAFTNNNQNTIVVKQSGAQIGQRDGLSDWDAFKVNKMHGCPA